MSTMTLQEISEAIRRFQVGHPDAMGSRSLHDCVASIDAHLAQPAQAVDVGVLHAVIAALCSSIDLTRQVREGLADRITRALSVEKAGRAETLQQALADISKAAISDQPEFAIRHYVEQRADEAWDGIWRPEYSRPMTTASPAPDKEG